MKNMMKKTLAALAALAIMLSVTVIPVATLDDSNSNSEVVTCQEDWGGIIKRD